MSSDRSKIYSINGYKSTVADYPIIVTMDASTGVPETTSYSISRTHDCGYVYSAVLNAQILYFTSR